MTKPKILLAQILFIAFLVPFCVIWLIPSVICRETWRALRSMYFEFRIELADLPRQWRALRDI